MLLRLRKRNLSKEPASVLDAGDICITSPEHGWIWMIARGRKLFRNWRTGQRLRDGGGACGPTRRVLRNCPREQVLGTTEVAMAITAERAGATKLGASVERSTTMNNPLGNPYTPC